MTLYIYIKRNTYDITVIPAELYTGHWITVISRYYHTGCHTRIVRIQPPVKPPRSQHHTTPWAFPIKYVRADRLRRYYTTLHRAAAEVNCVFVTSDKYDRSKVVYISMIFEGLEFEEHHNNIEYSNQYPVSSR